MFAGTWTLVKLILRRDRIKLPLWILSVVVSLIAMVPLLKNVYGDQQSLQMVYQTFSINPAGLFITGPMDAPTFGAMMTIETLLWWGLAVAFMNVLLIVRHTRQNEETGAQELLLSGRVHRNSTLLSVLIVAYICNALVAVGMGTGLTLSDADWNAQEAWLYGISMGLFGCVWASITAVVVQLTESSRSAVGISAGLVGVAFVLRGIGDFMGTIGPNGVLQPTWLSAVSPFGWLQAVRALTFPDWSPLVVFFCWFVGLAVFAVILLHRRDIGSGIFMPRKGRTHASLFRKTPLGFSWYLQRSVFIGWFVGVVLMACIIGVLVPEMNSIYSSSESMKAIVVSLGGQGAIVPVFLSAMLSIMVLMVSAYVIQALCRLRSEELSGHLEQILATRLSRQRWLLLHTGIILVAGACMLASTGLVMALCVIYGTNIDIDVVSYVIAGLSYWPVLLLFVALYVIFFGILPKLANSVTWIYYAIVVFVTWLAPMLKIDQVIMNISPMTHLAAAPAENIVLMPMVIMTGIALTCFVIGSVAWSRRDIIHQ